MSKAKTRLQHVYLEVKKGWENIVELYGPTEVISAIYDSGYNNDCKKCSYSYLGTSMKLILSGTGSDLPFMKASVLEEVLKRGFTPLSNTNDDSLTFTREVPLSTF